MQTAKQNSWKISINAKSSNFHFKFNATSTNPTCKFSLFLKLRQFLLQFNSEPAASTPKKQTTSLKSKILKIFHKFKSSEANKKAITSHKTPSSKTPETEIASNPLKRSTNEEPICIGSLFFRTLALLSKSIFENDQKGVAVHGLSILSFMALFFKKLVTIRARTLMVYLTMALLAFAIIFQALPKYIYYGNRDCYVFQFAWRAWNYIASSESLYVLCQAIFSRFCQSVGVNFLTK